MEEQTDRHLSVGVARVHLKDFESMPSRGVNMQTYIESGGITVAKYRVKHSLECGETRGRRGRVRSLDDVVFIIRTETQWRHLILSFNLLRAPPNASRRSARIHFEYTSSNPSDTRRNAGLALTFYLIDYANARMTDRDN